MKTVELKKAPVKPRGPYNNACDVCRDRKVKCEGNPPVCDTCQHSNRHSECSWVKNPTRKPRTEQYVESLRKRAENLQTLLHEYRRYTDYLESLLDQTPNKTVEFRSSRPSDSYEAMRSDDDFEDSFDFIPGDDDDSDESTDEFYRPLSHLTLEEDGRVHHYGLTAIFRFINNKSELSKQPSRFPAIVEDPHETYVLIVDAASEKSYNPDFEWSRHLPSEVPLDRKSHDKALDLLFKFFTSWCLRMVPALFLRDMYRALRLPRSRTPPKTPHYSPMLHNSLIALALAFLDDPKFRDLKSRQYFAEKAKSFTEAECQKPNISVVQALSFLGSFHSSQGDQTLGYLYFGMSVRVAQALGLNVDCTELVKSGLMEESDRLDRNWANWTIFGQDVCWSLYVGRNYSVPVPDPDFPMPMVDIALDQMPWTHGQANTDPQPNYLTKTFEASCELLKISRRIMDVNNFLTKKKTRSSVIDEVISGIDLKLNTWRGCLPQELEITVKSRPTSTPHKLMLHLIYWWMFVLLHRPFFHRKVRQIASADREIDHVKLCRRAADNIMENLATWRSLYDLRYCPVTLVQTVFSAGTVYLLTAMRASSGVRVAQKELGHAMKQQDLVMQYLDEIGKSWQCATNIAGILKGLMQDQLAPLLDRRALVHNDSQQVPNDKEERKVSITRPIAIRRSNSKSKRRVSVSRGILDTPPRTSVSPIVTFSLVDSKAPNHSASSSPQDYLSPTTLSGPSFSSKCSSPIDIPSWRNPSRTQVCTSPASSHHRRLSDASAQSVASSPATSFVQSTFQYSPPPISHHIGHEILSRNGVLASSEEQIAQANAVQVHSSGQSPSTSSYLPDGYTGLQVILGGQTIPPTPFLPSSFSLGDGSSGPTTEFDMSFFDNSSHVSLDQSQSGGNDLNHYASSNSMETSNGTNEMDMDLEEFDQWFYSGVYY